MSLVQKMWTLLDATMDELMVGPNPELKARARAQAEMLALFMSPHFTTADEIAREAARRYKARKEGDSRYETVGLGSLIYAPPPGVDKYKPAERTQPHGAPRRVDPAKNALSDAEKNTIKTASQLGFFTEEQLAKTYGVSVEIIRSISSS